MPGPVNWLGIGTFVALAVARRVFQHGWSAAPALNWADGHTEMSYSSIVQYSLSIKIGDLVVQAKKSKGTVNSDDSHAITRRFFPTLRQQP